MTLPPWRIREAALVALIACAAALPARADVLRGRVTDVHGTPVVDADFDVFTLAGELLPQDDNTDADGSYEITLPPGRYDLICEPAVSSGLAAQAKRGMIVGGDTRLNWELVASTRVIGRVHGPSGPAAAVDLDFDRLADGLRQPAGGDITSPFGTFATYIEPGAYRVSFFPPENSGLAPARIDSITVPTADTLDVALVLGSTLTGLVRSRTGDPIAGARLSFIDDVIGARVPALGNYSRADGSIRSVVRPGRFRIQLTPPRGTGWIALESSPLDLSADATWNPLVDIGYVVSGIVTDPSGRPLVGADWDVFEQATLEKVVTGDDNTDYDGRFSLALPGGTYEMHLNPPAASGLGPLVFGNVSIVASRIFDVSYAAVQPPGALRMRPARNPSHGGGDVLLSLPHSAYVVVELFDTAGRRVRELLARDLPAGLHRLAWDGRNSAGSSVGAGVFFVRATVGADRTFARWIVLP